MHDHDLLAIDGGLPAVPEGPPTWPPADDAVRDALAAAYADGSWGRYLGPHTQRLSELLAAMHGVRHAWLCSSGTIAVELALRGLKIGPDDEVILAAYDFPGNFRAIEAIGARPVLVDVGPAGPAGPSWTMDVEQLAAAISPQTKAVLVSHLHGSLADMRQICDIAARHGWVVVEDACQVPGAIVGGKPAGAWGDCGVLSFGGSKLLTAGRGGCILTNRDDVVQRIKVFSQRGNEAFPLSELQAAVLVPQLPKFAAQNRQRLSAVRQLLAATRNLPDIENFVIREDEQNVPAFYKLPWLLMGNSDDCDSPQFEARRRRFIAAIQAEGVAMDEGFRGFARRTGNRCRVVGDLPNARRMAAGTLILHHPVLREPPDTIERVAHAIHKVAKASVG